MVRLETPAPPDLKAILEILALLDHKEIQETLV
jgi:hypothetical protein